MILRSKCNTKLDVSSQETLLGETEPFRLVLVPGQTVTVADKYRKLRNIDSAINQGLLEVISYDASPGVEVIQDKASRTVERLDGTNDPGTGVAFSLGTHKHDGGGGAWGTITGDINEQTDLQEALADVTPVWGAITGNIADQHDLGDITLGNPTTGDYNDGLFPWVANTTKIADAEQSVNEVLAALAPAPAPEFSQYNNSEIGVTGKVSYDSTHSIGGVFDVTGVGNCTALNVDGSFAYNGLSGMRRGIFSSAQTTFTGFLASNVSAGSGSPSPAYPQYAFIDGDAGTLSIFVNDDVTAKHTVNLTTFASGSSVNANGTGFTNVSAVTNELFPNGTEFSLFKYRTAKWVVDDADLREGWNWVRITHTVGTARPAVNLYCDFIRDLNATATEFSVESLGTFVGTGSKHLSGVEYFTGGSAAYAVTIDNLYRNTYYSGSDAITYSNEGTNLQSISNDTLSAGVGDEAKFVTVSKTVNVIASGIRIMNGSITVKATAKRTVQSTTASTGSSVNSILLDNVTPTPTVTFDDFDDENYRLLSNISFEDDAQAIVGTWNSTESLVDIGTVGYNNGLQVVNSTLIYPVTNYSAMTNGPTGNVDYSTGVTGIKEYYRFFNLTATGATGNFTLTVSGTATPRSNSYSMTNGTNDIKIDVKLPNDTSEGTGWLDCTALFATGEWLDGDGCLLTGSFSSSDVTNGVAKSLTVGTRSTGATSVNGKVFIRIRVPQAWSGILNSIRLVGA